MAIPTDVQTALDRLVQYNSNPVGPGNPYGFANYGNLTNFPAALQDAALVATWIGATGGLPGPAGEDGADGTPIELQRTVTHVQWRYVGEPTWTNLFALADLKGDKGDQGDKGDKGDKGEQGDSFEPDAVGLFAQRPGYDGEAAGFAFLATDTGELYFRQGGSGWSAGLPFGKGEKGDKGDKGDQGDQGAVGADGREVELQKTATHIQWRYVGETGWNNLAALADLKGDKGDQGDQGPPGTTDYNDLSNRPTLGSAAALNVGTTAGTVAAGDDARLRDLASTAEIRAKNAAKPITMGGAADAAAPVAKTWTGAVTVDFAEFTGALVVTGTGNVTLGAVSNAKPGTSGTFEFLHSGAARTIAVNATYWDTPGGAGLTLSTTAGQRDLLAYYVKASGKIMLTVAALNTGG